MGIRNRDGEQWWIGWRRWPALLLIALLIPGAVQAADFVERLAQAEQLINSDPRAAVRIASEVLSGAEATGDQLAQAEALRLLGIGQNITGSNELALQTLQRALVAIEALGDQPKRNLLFRNLGVVHFDAGRSDQALEYYLQALAGFEARGEAVEVAKTRANIANVYMRIGNPAAAVQQHRAALAAFEAAGATLPIAASHLNLGAALRAQAELPGTDAAKALYREAQRSFQRSATIFRGLDISRGVLKAEANLAATLASLGEDEAASASFRGVLKMARELGDVQEEVLALKRLLAVEDRLGRLESARAAAAEGLLLAERLDNADARESFHRSLSALHEAAGDASAALEHARHAEALGRERLQGEQSLRVAEITRRYENAQRDRELDALRQAAELDQAELGRQRVLRNAAIVIGVLAMGLMLLLASRSRLRERSRAELERAAQTDPLTGLLNRRGLRQQVGAGVFQDGYAVLLCDVDNFKRINDQHGHDVGDLVLIEAASRLRAALRPDDHAVRWGGEEFLLVLPQTDSAGAMRAAERLRAAVADQPVGSSPLDLSITVSLGVAVVLPGQSFDAVVQAADHALLDAKQGGKNRAVFAQPRLRGIPNVAAVV